MAKILGLTGGIASGKTTVSNYFKKLKVDVVDADEIAHEIMRAGQPVVGEIAAYFGEEILLENGEINRERLGKIVFESDEKREKLNQIVQKKIRKKIKEERDKLLDKELIVLDIPLLYEQSYEDLVDQVMVVSVKETVQKKRLMDRNSQLTEEDAMNRIASQMSLEEKVRKADIVIDNNGSIENTMEQVRDWLKESGFSSFFIEKNH